MSRRQYLIVVSVCVSLMIHELGVLCLLAVRVSSLEKCPSVQVLCPFLNHIVVVVVVVVVSKAVRRI